MIQLRTHAHSVILLRTAVRQPASVARAARPAPLEPAAVLLDTRIAAVPAFLMRIAAPALNARRFLVRPAKAEPAPVLQDRRFAALRVFLRQIAALTLTVQQILTAISVLAVLVVAV